ncbi:MucB/RseB C-terminal domain-containing protein [Pseudomonas sp. dw_358]|uniref:MucB/RseB C-terminal domain-containing protein n=1 Tax=Pseudomonas sp. dw_358 TaxID=2720083 RepID=UPI001BD34242|nr:MucB/RseB C-terminal domain-containing protein [Pseudomonas sp. dw_358]
MRAFPLTAVLLVGCFAAPAFAATDAAQWLGRMAQAEQQQSFQGTFIYERAGSFSSHDIWHRANQGRVSERLYQLDGPPREVLRVDDSLRCVSGSSPMPGAGAASSSPILDPLKLMSWYTLNVGGESRVAGREAVVVTLTPKDQQRYGFEMHLDKQTGLPLKSLLLNDKGQLLERFQYTRFSTDAPSDTDLTATDDCKPVAPANQRADTSPAPWRSDWLPAGFELLGQSAHLDPQRKVVVASLMYGDGLARVSVFIEPLAANETADTHAQLGPTAAVSRRLAGKGGDLLVTVVGEVPIGTAERIALSVRADDVKTSP